MTPLDDAVTRGLQFGARLESRTDTSATLVYGKPVNHVLHLILTLVTCGLWVPFWLGFGLLGGETRTVLTIAPDGSVIVRKVP